MGNDDNKQTKTYLNFLTSGVQTAYKDGSSTIDVLYLLSNTIKHGNKNQLILFDPPNAFGAINRDILRTILYERSLPSNIIKIIRMGHQRTTLKPKNNGVLGKSKKNNKGVVQGIPLSSYLFIIYAERMMGI